MPCRLLPGAVSEMDLGCCLIMASVPSRRNSNDNPRPTLPVTEPTSMLAIRKASLSDRDALWEIRTRAIRETCSSHYVKSETDNWAACRMPDQFAVAIQTADFLVA